MKSAIDHYIESTNAILEAKLAKKKSEAQWASYKNKAVFMTGVALVIVAFAWAYHQFLKPPREVINTIIEKEVVTKIIEKKSPIILADGSTVMGNGTIIKPDGSVVTSIDGLIRDVEVAVAEKGITGVQHYSLFVQENVLHKNNKTVAVRTGYRFDLASDSTHPVMQWCNYSSEPNTIRNIAQLDGYDHSPTNIKNISAYDKKQLSGCKWLTTKVTDHFSVVDEAEVSELLKKKVDVAIDRFEQLTQASTKEIIVNYGRFDREVDGNDLLGSCFFDGYEMQINVDRLNAVSDHYVKAVVFHELSHCIFSLDHNHDENSIMYPTITDKMLSQSDVDWAKNILSLRR